MKPITENDIESLAIETLQSLGWEYVHGLMVAPHAEQSERENFEQIILVGRLRKAVSILNPEIPADIQEQAIQKVLRIYSPDLLHNNETFHQLLVEKVKIPYQKDGFERSYEVALIDFENTWNNEFLSVNQYTIMERKGGLDGRAENKRPDVLLFVNGIPLVVMELKNAADEKATMRKAFDQIQTYKATIPSLFTYNAFCVISDGHECKAGSISAGFSRFMSWKTADGIKEASRFRPHLEILLKGMMNPPTFLDLIRNFIVFEKNKKEDSKTGITQLETIKKLAAYHQYYAVNRAVESTIIASGTNGDKRGGVVWHTQGSGKSLSMVFYSGKLITAPEMQNPTILVITDRNDLDDQLFDTFAGAKQLLRQIPVQAKDREQLKDLLKVGSGGIVFATIQKFLPDNQQSVYDRLSERTNIVVIADEAHRTQYGFEASIKEIVDKETKESIGKRIAYGFAKYMRDALPNATYIGFTGTPIEGTDVNTPQVFGQYVDVYDISQAVADGATVRIYYESRLAKVNLDEEGKRLIKEFDAELELNSEITDRQKANSKYTKLEAIVGNADRIKNLAKDIVTHFEQRQKVFDGKAMIVCMSRRIAVELYQQIIALKPHWQSDDLKLVIVCDMWLTGFDAPCLHTMYIDKPMRGHNLMQAIARLNPRKN